MSERMPELEGEIRLGLKPIESHPLFNYPRSELGGKSLADFWDATIREFVGDAPGLLHGVDSYLVPVVHLATGEQCKTCQPEPYRCSACDQAGEQCGKCGAELEPCGCEK